MQIRVMGAGIMGQTLASHLIDNNFAVELLEKNQFKDNCSYAAAGMLSPFAETVSCLLPLNNIGNIAIDYWKTILPKLSIPIYFNDSGTLCLADQNNTAELEHFKNVLKEKINIEAFRNISVADYEPEINGVYQRAILLKEAQVDAQQLMSALNQKLQKVRSLGADPPEWIVDCRGLGASDKLQDLRGVRGELIHLYAPTVVIKHVLRYFHPRYHIYIIPRANHHYIIGASTVEVEDYSAIRVMTILELLTSAYHIHKGFAEAAIVKTLVHCRPAFTTNLPKIIVDYQKNIIRVNGLYRYGYLFAPFFSLAIETFLTSKQWPTAVQPFLIIIRNADERCDE